MTARCNALFCFTKVPRIMAYGIWMAIMECTYGPLSIFLSLFRVHSSRLVSSLPLVFFPSSFVCVSLFFRSFALRTWCHFSLRQLFLPCSPFLLPSLLFRSRPIAPFAPHLFPPAHFLLPRPIHCTARHAARRTPHTVPTRVVRSFVRLIRVLGFLVSFRFFRVRLRLRCAWLFFGFRERVHFLRFAYGIRVLDFAFFLVFFFSLDSAVFSRCDAILASLSFAPALALAARQKATNQSRAEHAQRIRRRSGRVSRSLSHSLSRSGLHSRSEPIHPATRLSGVFVPLFQLWRHPSFNRRICGRHPSFSRRWPRRQRQWQWQYSLARPWPRLIVARTPT